jgi:hypothetical protein
VYTYVHDHAIFYIFPTIILHAKNTCLPALERSGSPPSEALIALPISSIDLVLTTAPLLLP